LVEYAASPQRDQRAQAARHVDTPASALVALAGDEDATVRMCVAHNSSCPPEANARLVHDEHEPTAQKATRGLITQVFLDEAPQDLLDGVPARLLAAYNQRMFKSRFPSQEVFTVAAGLVREFTGTTGDLRLLAEDIIAHQS
jgi:hypothetical protein